MKKTTLIIGASPKKERYSNMALNLLKEKGYHVIPVNPATENIDGVKTIKNLTELKEPVHTVTLYVNAKRLTDMAENIIKIKPERIIFNPGTESKELMEKFNSKGIETLEACTLVMLNTGQY
jgi:predicted CoA-binding protein